MNQGLGLWLRSLAHLGEPGRASSDQARVKDNYTQSKCFSAGSSYLNPKPSFRYPKGPKARQPQIPRVDEVAEQIKARDLGVDRV